MADIVDPFADDAATAQTSLTATKPAPSGGIVDPFAGDGFSVAPEPSSSSFSRLGEAAKAVTEFPSDLYKAGAGLAGSVSKAFNPYDAEAGKERDAYLKEVSQAPWYDIRPGIKHTFQQGKDIGSALLSPLAAASDVVASPLGHIYDALTPNISDEQQKKLGVHVPTGKEVVETALSALRPKGIPTVGGPSLPRPPGPAVAGVRPGPYERPPGSPELTYQPRVASPVEPQPPKFGVTLSEGEEANNLPHRVQENDYLRQAGTPHAQSWIEQRKDQLEAAPHEASKTFDPQGQNVVDSSAEAADILDGSLAQQQKAIDAVVERYEQGLRTDHENFRKDLAPSLTEPVTTPLDAADRASWAVSNENERAQAAVDAAYARFREMPGTFHPASFNKTAEVIRTKARVGDDPSFINPETTPRADSALKDMDELLSGVTQQRDPETGRIIPKAALTPQIVETARKRLNTFYSSALSAARSSGNWADVRAVDKVRDLFDAEVLRKLDTTFTGGDPRDVSSAINWARGQYANYRKTFTPQGAGDSVGQAIQKIVGRYEGQAATPEQVQNMLYGKGDLPVKVGRRLIGMFGEDSPEVGAVKQGLYTHITERPPGAEAWGPEKVADRIDEFTKGPGRSLTQTYFSPDEIAKMQQFGKQARAHAANVEAAENPFEGVNFLNTFRKAVNGDKDAVGLLEKALDRVGADTPQGSALRQGLFLHALQPVEGAAGAGPGTAAKSLAKLMQSTRNSPIFTPEHRAVISEYMKLMQQIEMPRGTYAPSAPAISRAMSAVGYRIGQVIGAIVGGHVPGIPHIVGEFAGITIGGKLERAAELRMLRNVKQRLPLVGEQLRAYQKAQTAYAKAVTPMSKAAVVTAGASLTKALEPLGVSLRNLPLQLPGFSPAQEDQGKEKGRASGGRLGYADGGAPDPSLADSTPVYDWGQGPNGVPRLQVQPQGNPEAPAVDPFTDDPFAGRLASGPQTGRVVNRLFGLNGEERYQTWPERVVRSGLSLAHDVATGAEPVTTLRREDLTDEPPPSADTPSDKREGGIWPFNQYTAPVAADPRDRLIERTQDMASLAGGASLPMAEEGAVGMVGGKMKQPPFQEGHFETYHGSPHAFKKFDMDNFGDGAGADVTYYGHFTTDSPDVAVDYAMQHNSPGYVYKTALRGHPERNYLDLEKPLSNQHPDVREAVARIPEVQQLLKTDKNPTADDIYTAVAASDRGPEQASIFRNESVFGVVGPEHNSKVYTTFDARDLKVLGRERPWNLTKFLSDTQKPGAALASFHNQPPFYSQVERAIANAPQNKATPEQWVGWLKNQPGVKAEELNWLGLGDDPRQLPPDWKGSVTKDQLLQHVKDNGVQLKEVEKKGDPSYPDSDDHAHHEAEHDFFHQYPRATTDDFREWQDTPEGQRSLAEHKQDALARPKYADYQLPGGENYRELLLTLPSERLPGLTPQEAARLNELEYNDAAYGLSKQAQNERQQLLAKSGIKNDAPEYNSSHWDEPNVVSHLRLNDRNIPDVGKSLHIEEVQSDWAQSGRKNGYQGDYRPVSEIDQDIDKLVNSGPTYDRAKYDELIAERAKAAGQTSVPDHPFPKTWPDLLLKRAISKAAREGYDAVSWTPGEQQAARYDLSKHLDGLVWTSSHGEYALSGMKNGYSVLTHSRVPQGKLADFVGKDAAEKIINGGRSGKLEGLDLKVGGEGMKSFYDKMLVDKANAIGKKFGAKVEWKDLPTKEGNKVEIVGVKPNGELAHPSENPATYALRVDGELRPERFNEYSDARMAREWVRYKDTSVKVPVLRLTPKLKEAAQQGLPLFSDTSKSGAALSAQDDKREVPRPPTQQPDANQPSEPQTRAKGGRVNASNVDTNPTEAQKQAGNYSKDHLAIHGLNITIENPKGSVRRGVGKDGILWSATLPSHYGYLRRQELGNDGDPIDVYLGPHKLSKLVFVIDQVDPDTRKFDEHKVFLCWASKEQALSAYKKAFSDGKATSRIGSVKELTLGDFKHWLSSGETKKPISAFDFSKLDHKTVDYVTRSRYAEKRCFTCSMYFGPVDGGPACTLVDKPIYASGWCRRFVAKT